MGDPGTENMTPEELKEYQELKDDVRNAGTLNDGSYESPKKKPGMGTMIERMMEKDPTIMKTISKLFVRQGLVMGFFLSFFIVGFTLIFNAARAMINFGPSVDAMIGGILVGIGAVYILQKLRK
jgi:hypothetical protein